MHGNLATIVPSGFSQVNDAFPGTREIPLTNPVVSKPVGLIWEKVNPPLPMAHAFSKILVEFTIMKNPKISAFYFSV